MSEINLDERFPDMRPIGRPPSLFTINGVGTGMYGSRDYDDLTRTYVKTLCICFLFVPLIPLFAYRVADAPRGWYFLGKVPLSPFARAWNYLLLLLALGGGAFGGWSWYTNTPEYVARHTLEEGDRLAAQGQLAAAAEKYDRVSREYPQSASEASARLNDLISAPLLDAPAAEVVSVLRVAARPNNRLTPNVVYEHGRAWIDRHTDDPRGVIQVLDVITPLAPEEGQAAAQMLAVLERLNHGTPDDLDVLSRLAVAYEATHQRERCEGLLLPHCDKLGGREGARILGQLLADKGQFDQAEPLLLAYCDERLEKLHEAEKRQEAALHAAQTKILNALKDGTAPGFDFTAYQRSSEMEKTRIVTGYVQRRLMEDPAIQAEESVLARERRVVPVALDLGIVMLRRAQGLPEPERQQRLERAEKVFLAIRGQAGETDQYRLQLGQVYYWMGKDAKGKELFDELLQTRNRDAVALLAVSSALRNLGNVAQARDLAEEAYRTATDSEQKREAAAQRALVFLDLEDEISWLQKAQLTDPAGRAELAAALGRKAYQDGHDDEAARHAREAIALYGSVPESASVLNNAAVANFLLYNITGDHTALDTAIANLQKAIALEPGHSILLSNAAGSILEVALRDAIHKGIDLRALRQRGSFNLLAYLYDDDAGRERYRQQVREHPGIKRALSFYERLQVLAPKHSHARQGPLEVYRYTHDTEALRTLVRQLSGVELDLTDYTREMRESFAGKKEDRARSTLQAGIPRLEADVQTLRTKKDRTFAVAAMQLVHTRLSLDQLGEKVDLDVQIALAQEAYDAAPSRATRGALYAVLFQRAGKALAKEQPAYRALAEKVRRSLSPTYLIAFLLGNDGPLGDAAAKNPDVQRAITLVTEQAKHFPSDADGFVWATLRRTNRAEANRLAAQMRTDEAGRLAEEISFRLQPLDADEALEMYWRLKAIGKDADAEAHLKRCAGDGVPLPVDEE